MHNNNAQCFAWRSQQLGVKKKPTELDSPLRKCEYYTLLLNNLPAYIVDFQWNYVYIYSIFLFHAGTTRKNNNYHFLCICNDIYCKQNWRNEPGDNLLLHTILFTIRDVFITIALTTHYFFFFFLIKLKESKRFFFFLLLIKSYTCFFFQGTLLIEGIPGSWGLWRRKDVYMRN